MSDLISRLSLKDRASEYALSADEYKRLCKIIDTEPTAYSVDNVISQLEDYGNEEIDYYRNTPYENCIRECISKAIEIVKQNNVKQDNTFNDICEWKKFKNNSSLFETSCGYRLEEYFDTNACFCKQCGKRIEIVK